MHNNEAVRKRLDGNQRYNISGEERMSESVEVILTII